MTLPTPAAAVPPDELAARHREVQRALAEAKLDALIVIQKADLYYLSGTTQDAHLVLPREGEPRLLVRKVPERVRLESPIASQQPFGSLKELRGQLRELLGPPPWKLGFELDVLPVSSLRRYEAVLGEGASIADASRLLLRARSVKSEWEIEAIRDAGRVHARLFERVPEFLEEGVSCFALQARLGALACELGHLGIIRMRGLDVACSAGVVVSGPEGAVPGHSMFPIGGPGPHPWVAAGGGPAPIARDVPVILDFLNVTRAYHADCTRMAVVGSFPAEATAILGKLAVILRSIEAELRPGAIPSEIYARAVERAREAGLADGFMGREPYAVRFVGHGVGLEVNETPVLAPRFSAPLVAGNVLAVEPKFTHPEFGVIGLENTYVVTSAGAENLTPCSEEVIAA